MKRILNYFRVKEWYGSKIPLAMAIFLHCCLSMEEPLQNREFAVLYGAFFFYFVTYFAFNYLINDFFDREADRLAGKHKVILYVPVPAVAASLAVLFLGGNLVMWTAAGFRPAVIAVTLVTYLLGASYSIRGLRMKERGVWGLIVSSFAQRNSPILLLAVLLPMRPEDFWRWMVVAFVNGLRYILIHQYIDQENDRKSHIRTFVADSMHSIGTAIGVCLALELVTLALLFSEQAVGQPQLLLLLPAYLLLSALNGYFVTRVLSQSWLYSFANVPLEDLCNVYLPLILTFAWVQKSGMYLLGVLTLLYLWIPLKKKLGMPWMAVRKLLEKRWGRQT